jgi:hypothetical protein
MIVGYAYNGGELSNESAASHCELLQSLDLSFTFTSSHATRSV